MDSTKLKNAEVWTQRIAEQAASGKNATQWCLDHRLCYKTFINWRIKLKTPSTNHQMKPPRFIELKDSASSKTGIEIYINGFSIVVSKNFDRTTLLHVLALLGKTRC